MEYVSRRVSVLNPAFERLESRWASAIVEPVACHSYGCSCPSQTNVPGFPWSPRLAQWNISPEALGTLTASNALEAVDPVEYAPISPQDFGSWFTDGGSPRGRGVAGGKRLGLGLATLAREDVEHPSGDTEELIGYVEQPRPPALWGVQLKRHGHSMTHARKLLCLDCFNINDLMEMLAEVEVEVSLECDNEYAARFRPWYLLVLRRYTRTYRILLM